MEFRKVAFDGQHVEIIGDDGQPVMRQVLDLVGKPVLKAGKPVFEPATEYVEVPGSAAVYESTQRFAEVDPKLFTEALKSFGGDLVEKIEHVAGGPIVVRVRKAN